MRLEKLLRGVLRRILSGQKAAIPEAGRGLMAIFFQLSEARAWHANGPNPIGFADIEAWIRMMGVPLQARHVAILRALDADWIEFFHRRRDDKSPDGTKALVRPPSAAPRLSNSKRVEHKAKPPAAVGGRLLTQGHLIPRRSISFPIQLREEKADRPILGPT